MNSLIDIYTATGDELDDAGRMQKKLRHLGECDADYRIRLLQSESPSNGGPAFGEFKQAGQCSIKTGGLTIRDYFAAKVIQGFSSSMGEMCLEDIEKSIPVSAQLSYAIADAMLAARGESK